jgi:hypothetical protein
LPICVIKKADEPEQKDHEPFITFVVHQYVMGDR